MATDDKPFVMFRTKQELMQSKVQNLVEFAEGVEEQLKQFSPSAVLGVTVTINSPPTIVSVKPADDLEDFSQLAF
ncbi:MAG: hypothetical protein NTW67_03230 [Candidatus Woesearchaeota archaeon]|nr:hypothetical protein [Candidatus Woesearchaeota archaeon]